MRLVETLEHDGIKAFVYAHNGMYVMKVTVEGVLTPINYSSSSLRETLQMADFVVHGGSLDA